MKRVHLISIIFTLSILLCDEGWIEVDGIEVSNHELTILIQENHAPLLGIEPALELSSIPVLFDAVSSFSNKELIPVFTGLELFTQIHRDYNLHRYYTLRIDPQDDLTDLIDELSNAIEIELIEYKYKTTLLTTTPNDNFYPEQWAHNNTGQTVGDGIGELDCDMDTDEAWDITRGNSDIIIAILDTGIDLANPEFIGKIVSPINFYNDDDLPIDFTGHGSASAGIAAAYGNNYEGIAGICWYCKIMPVKVCEGINCFPDFVANGIVFAHDNGADVISMSFGYDTSSSLIRDAINYAYDNGTVLFAATGNDDANVINFPAAEDNCIAVGAHSPCNERKSPLSCDGEEDWGSNYGDGIDFTAPTIVMTIYTLSDGDLVNRDYAEFSGTSAACSHAAGVAGLILSQNSELNPAEVREIMQKSSVDLNPDGGLGSDGYDIYTGFGRINANNALNYFLSRNYYHSGWNWVGFPWLVDNEDGIVGNNPDPVVDIFNSVEEDIDWIWIENYVNYVSNSAEWIEDEWDLSGGLSEVESALGYKIELPEGQVQFEIPFVGTRVPAETPIDLVEGENWVPYFLPYPQHPSDAFPQEVLDLMSSIKAENWFMVRRDDVFYVKVDCPPQTQGSEGECFMLEYGAMYIIEMEDDMSFIWNSNGIDPPIAPTEPKPAENFTFIQKRDYIPVVIESIENIENGENIQEIGARNTNDYVGAEVVYGYPINLRIYDQSLSDITFEVILEDESYGRQNNDADLPAGKHLLNINSITVENNIAFVQLSDFDKTVTNNSKLFSSVSANPNPLNPNVKIKFKLNSDAIVDLIIYDVKGRKINTLVSGSLSSGNHSYEWRGNNEKSAAVSSGIYFYYLQSGSEVIQNKIMLLK